jgi:phosphinothricin acetyltransferase
MFFRFAENKDLINIVEIYNQAINIGGATADTEIQTIQSKSNWFADFQYPYFILVCEIDNIIVGWCSIAPYRKGRKALSKTAEISYYVHNNFKGKSIGSTLIDFSIQKAKDNGIKNLLAIMLDTNLLSRNILLKKGFSVFGHLPNIVEFDNYKCGQFILGMNINI